VEEHSGAAHDVKNFIMRIEESLHNALMEHSSQYPECMSGEFKKESCARGINAAPFLSQGHTTRHVCLAFLAADLLVSL